MVSFDGAYAFSAHYSNESSEISSQVALVFDANCQPQNAALAISTGLPLLIEGPEFEQLSLVNRQTETLVGDNARAIIASDCALLIHWVDERDFSSLTEAAEEIYERLLNQARALGFQHWVRVWNYFADINGDEQGLERYRHFCKGRFNALDRHNLAEKDYPSACALGHQGGQILVYALVSNQPPEHFENPRQLAAYRYPAVYGPRSPSFARASVWAGEQANASLFLSGTAAVVGHETVHKGDLQGQVLTTLENIRKLIEHVSATSLQFPKSQWRPSLLKIYIRHAKDAEQVKQLIEAEYPQVPCVYLHADVCRADLLFEMDGLWNRVS